MYDVLKRDYLVVRSGKSTLCRILFEFFRNAGFRAVVLYRLGRWYRMHKLGLLAPITERFMHHLSHCWISTLAEIGPGFRIPHVCGIIIPPGIIIGENCEIRQNVTLGGNYGKTNAKGRTNPRLGNSVSLGPGAVVLGPVEIGDNTVIGANAVVTTDIPPNSVVGAFRAEILAYRIEGNTFKKPVPSFSLSRKEIAEELRTLDERIRTLESARGQCDGG